MPWEKSFDETAALESAMQAFWARGYDATSMQDLVACMGVGRGSLYATFGDKRTLFLRALRHYDARHRADWTARLADGHGPRAAILAVFDAIRRAVVEDQRREGCLLVNTALETAPHDPDVAAVVAEGLRGMETFFAAQIARGQASGEIGPDVAPEDDARALLALLVGMRVFSRARPEATLLDAVAAQAARIVDG